MPGKIFFSSPLTPAQIHVNQTAILRWLKSLGHEVSFVRNYAEGPRPGGFPRMMSGLPVLDEPRVAAAPIHPKPGTAPMTRPTSALASFVGKPCPYCGHEMETAGLRQPTRDHKHPRSAGGNFRHPRNKVICCRRCNENKGARTLEQWYERLKIGGDLRAERVGWLLLDETKGRGP